LIMIGILTQRESEVFVRYVSRVSLCDRLHLKNLFGVFELFGN
jgi:hypothetical protein